MEKDNIKRLGIYHSKDLDGNFSGAVLLHRFPDITLMGWDYADDIPDMESLTSYDEVIMIDVTFPLTYTIELADKVKLMVIDHHISFKNQVDEYNGDISSQFVNFKFLYSDTMSACELGCQYYLGHIPPIVEMVGKYDTWRANGTPEWDETIVPMKFYLYGKVGKPEDVIPEWFTNLDQHWIDLMLISGRGIMDYERKMDESKTLNYSFETEAYGLRALTINSNFFGSETMVTKFDPEKHDIMVGFAFNGKVWGVSLRSLKGGPNVSAIAKQRGGGGHFHAAGFEVKNFEDIFK